MSMVNGTAYILRPTQITESMLSTSTVAEPATGETAWSATEINAVGDQRYIGTPSSTVTISNGSPAVISWPGNNIAADTRLVFTTTGTLPTGLSVDTSYYVVDRLTDGTFTLSEELGGRPVNTSSAGSGTHTATAQVHMVYEALVGERGTVTITNATPAVVTWTTHGRAADDQVVFTTTGALPTGLTAGTTYYVIASGLSTNSFQVSATQGGAAINTSSAGSGTHTCGLAANYNKPPMINTDEWGEAWPTARWGAFDQAIGTYTTGASPLTMVLLPGPCSGLFLGDLQGASDLEITVKHQAGGTVIDTRTVELDVTPLSDIYDWFFADLQLRKNLLITGLPDQYFAPEVTVTLTGSSTIKVGVLAIGRAYNIGAGQRGAKARIMDFGSKITNSYGRTTFVEGDYSKRVNLGVVSNSEDVEWIFDLLADLRSIPAVYAGTTRTGHSPLLVYGVPTDWDVEFVSEGLDHWTLALEGLT